MRFIVLFLGMLLLAACSKEFSGIYGEIAGPNRYEFDKKGKVAIKVPAGDVTGANQYLDFTRKGDSIIIKNPDGSVMMTLDIVGDDMLKGMGGALTLRKKAD